MIFVLEFGRTELLEKVLTLTLIFMHVMNAESSVYLILYMWH